MDYDKNYFLNQLRNGQDINSIGQAMADAMNAAMADYTAEQEAVRKAEAEKAEKANLVAKKKELSLKMVDLFREYASLTGNTFMDEMDITEDDMNTLVETLDGTFALMGAMKELKNAIEAIPDEKVHTVHTKLQRAKTKSDDEILRDFIASLAQ